MNEAIKKKIFPTFSATHVEHINVDNEKLTTAEFSQSENFQWTESCVISFYTPKVPPELEKKAIIENALKEWSSDNSLALLSQRTEIERQLNLIYGKQHSSEIKNIDDFLKNPDRYNCMTIKTINSKIGKGVFLQNNVFLKKDNIVGVYAGTYEELTPSVIQNSVYLHQILPHPIFCDAQGKFRLAEIDAQNYGNITRFFNDLPEKSELEKYYAIDPNVLSDIATKNLDSKMTSYHGFPISYFTTCTPILPGQQLGFSYSIGYWAAAEYQKNIKRSFFNKKGGIIEEKHFQPKFLVLSIFVNAEYEYQPIPILIGNIKKYLLTETPFDLLFRNIYVRVDKNTLLATLVKKFNHNEVKQEDRYKCHFYYSIYFVLEDFLINHAYLQDSFTQQKVTYVKILKNAILEISCTNSDEAYKALYAIFNANDKIRFYKNELKELRSEIIKCMTKYNSNKNEAPKNPQNSNMGIKR